MVALWLVTGLLTMVGGFGLVAYNAAVWLADGLWQPVALADYVGVPATRSLLGLNQLLEVTFDLPLGIELILVGVVALLVGRYLGNWRALRRQA